jgi:TPP-dependent pyruvate/acetoin dehydrogenase alpha subunit
MGGHATHDEREARQLFDQSVYDEWGARDPIGCYEAWLMRYRDEREETLREIEERVIVNIDAAARFAQSRKVSHAPSADELMRGVYAQAPATT